MSVMRTRTVVLGWMAAGLSLLAVAPAANAQRPAAPRLLPKTTLAYVRVADSRDLVDRFMQTSTGRLGQDEKIKPLIMSLYGSAAQAFSRVQDEIGVSLEQILSIPQGEVCAAVVGRQEGSPGFIVLMDVGDQLPVVRQLLDRAEQEAIRQGQSRRTEEVDGTTLTVIGENAAYCVREGTVLFGSHAGLVGEVLRTWSGDEGAETLADNREFTAIMSRSVGTKDERPQLTWFVDPIAFFRNVSRENVGAQVALAALPVLGLNGLKSAGGSMIFATEDFDSISHFHLLLDNPRRGVLEMLAIESGDMTPEEWVPSDSASYMTIRWNVNKAVEAARKLVDQFRGRDAMSNLIQRRISTPLGVDFEKDVLGQLDNRFTHVSWFEKPARVNSGTNLVGIRVANAKAFQGTLDQLMSRMGAAATRKSYRGINYYEITPRRTQQVDETIMRQPTPCVALVGDYVLLSDSVACLQAAITGKNTPNQSLANELEYKLIASRIQQHLGSQKPGMVSFARPEESLRSFYDLATSPSSRRRLEEAAPTNPALRALHEALRDHPLPPFSEIAKYLAPGGGMLVSDETGIHYVSFALKRE